jgi:hypothetical protein
MIEKWLWSAGEVTST